MEALLIALVAAVGFLAAYNTYGRWLGRRIFRLSADAVCPSIALRDDRDYCPTPKGVVFGHHFTSIAGTGPIVGPAIAIMWGWLPALLWVLLGSIFIGAVHDFASLVVSLRHRGQTVGEIAGTLLSKRIRLLFLLILVLALTIVLAIFGLVIAAVFRLYPSSILPCLLQIPLAVTIGWALHRGKGNLLIYSLVALFLMYFFVLFGDSGPLHAANQYLADLPVATWVSLLLIYAYAASVLPVWVLLQPRDYINALQLLSSLGLIVLGLLVAGFFGASPERAGEGRVALEIVAPMVDWAPPGAPAIFPFLFITIACGAVSGFHCLVSSGTSSKQIANENDAQLIGYGAMLTEGFLAVLVILACAAGLGLGITGSDGSHLTGEQAWQARYGSWNAAEGLGAKIGSFVDGAANLLATLGFSGSAATALVGVFVASFAATTMDTACRLQRYVVQELGGSLGDNLIGGTRIFQKVLQHRHGATILAVSIAFVIAMYPLPGETFNWETAGRGGLLLWPLFGATNQLLGGLAFLVIIFYLKVRGLPIGFALIPMVFMLLMPFLAMFAQVFLGNGSSPGWWVQGKFHLAAIGILSIALEIWMIIEAVRLARRNWHK